MLSEVIEEMIKLINESIETPAYALSKGMQYKGFDGRILEVVEVINKNYDNVTVRVKDKNGRISDNIYKNDYIFYVLKNQNNKSITPAAINKVKLTGTVMRENDIIDYSFSAEVSSKDSVKELTKLAKKKYGKSVRIFDIKEIN